MNIKEILKKPIDKTPISAKFIHTKKVDPLKEIIIKPVKLVSEFDEKGRENIELWLSFCAIGTTILSTGTKMLSHLGVIHKRDAIHDLIAAFQGLRKHFSGNVNFDEKEKQIDDFMYQFLTGSEEHQKRVIKFQESILNKTK